MSDFQVTRFANGDFRVDPVPPPERPFGACFQTEMFDFNQSQGLAVRLANGKAHAFLIHRHFPGRVAAAGLRSLAKWIEANA